MHNTNFLIESYSNRNILTSFLEFDKEVLLCDMIFNIFVIKIFTIFAGGNPAKISQIKMKMMKRRAKQ